MKKLVAISFVVLNATSLFALPVEPLNDVTRHVTAYLPYIRMLVYIIAVMIGIGGGVMVTYMRMVNQEANVKPRIVATAASCVMLISMAIALPQFFGYEADGSSGQLLASLPQTGLGDLGNTAGYGGVDGDYIKTDIPDLDDPRWQDDPDYKTITVDGKESTISSFLEQTYEMFEPYSPYQRTYDYIHNLYWGHQINYDAFMQLMNHMGSLPHN